MFSGGAGTKQKPYLIKTVEDLLNVRIDNAFNPTNHYKQIADIDLTGVEWLPIGGFIHDGPTKTFQGVYDGGIYKIINMTINDKSLQYAGFIGIATPPAKLLNITLDNALIHNAEPTWLAVLVSQAQSITITNCHVNGEVISTNVNSNTGGLASVAGNGTVISKCSADVRTVSGNAGGLVCYSYADISDSYAIGSIGGVDGFLSSAGTLAFQLYSGKVTNCYTSVEIHDYAMNDYPSIYLLAQIFEEVQLTSCYVDVTKGCIQTPWSSDKSYSPDHFIRGTDNRLYQCYNSQNSKDYDYWESAWDSSGPPAWWPAPYTRACPVSGEVWSNFWKPVDSLYDEARTTTNMKKQSTFIDWDFNNVWIIDEGKDYPRLIALEMCECMGLISLEQSKGDEQ